MDNIALKGILLKALMVFSLMITLITTLSVIIILSKESFYFFKEINILEFIFGTKWSPLFEPRSYGIIPLVFGTMFIVFGSMIIAVPFGIMIAAYLNEYSNHRIRLIIKPSLEVLAGIPTIVYGYFALTFITPMLKHIFPNIEVFNAASAAIVVGIMILPMVASLSDDAFRALPKMMIEGGYALGAKPYEIITQISIPATISRIGAIFILAISRAAGETMAVSLAAGSTPNIDFDPFKGIQTMTAYIVQVSMGDLAFGSMEYYSSFGVAFTLFVITFLMNLIANNIMLYKPYSKDYF